MRSPYGECSATPYEASACGVSLGVVPKSSASVRARSVRVSINARVGSFLMSEPVSLHERIQSAIHAHLLEEGGGIPVGYLAAVHYVNNDGSQTMAVIAPEDQITATTMGFAAYLSKVADLNAEFELTVCDCDDDDCDRD